MGIWTVLSSIATVFAGCGAVLLGVGCVWPTNQPRRPASRREPASTQCHLRTTLWPEAWTCDTPAQPLTVAEAHRAMQLHRDHDCARKRAAFAALVAAGRITPDSARQHHPWRNPS
ncbi:hypothetical protein [Nocardia abscessus]|uniref:hypothetical protein n=1 Tax=Nocardia abscessus TaxID=120957 RepID=UPI002454F395|nr:hypothetical protein [Nocardia abscessus]